MAGSAQLVKAYPSANNVIALNTITAGSTATATGLVLQPFGANNIEFDSLCINVSAVLATASLTAQPILQVSQNGTTWVNLAPLNNAASVVFPATATTNVVLGCAGLNLSYPYVRFAVLTAGATGGAGDNVTATYNWRKRLIIGG
jgi:hypothetical protein